MKTATSPRPAKTCRPAGAPQLGRSPVDPEAVARAVKPISAKLFDDSPSSAETSSPHRFSAILDWRSTMPSSRSATIAATRQGDLAQGGQAPRSGLQGHPVGSQGILAQAEDALDKTWHEPKEVAQRFLAFRELDDETKAAWLSYVVAVSLEAKSATTRNTIRFMRSSEASSTSTSCAMAGLRRILTASTRRPASLR